MKGIGPACSASPVSSLVVPATAAAAAAAAGTAALYLLHRSFGTGGRRRWWSDLAAGTTDDDDDDEDGSSGGCVYLDYNGTTPIHPLVVTAMLPYLTRHFGNPSSSHAYGTVPRRAVDSARRSVGALLGPPSQVRPDESIVFTGCGTESDNLAIHLALRSSPAPTSSAPGRRHGRHHVVTSNVEHPAISECLSSLESDGTIDVTYVPVNTQGMVAASDVVAAIVPDRTVLVTIMLANNEVGSLQPVAEVATACRRLGVLFHTDAAQAVGKVSVALDDTGDPDMVTIVGHKFGAPKGVAALYVRPGCLSERGRTVPPGFGSAGALLLGGGQEGGRRAGTENVPYVVGMGRAAEILTEGETWRENARRMGRMRERLLDNLVRGLEGDGNGGGGGCTVRPNGPTDASLRLPNTLSVGLRGVQSGDLLQRIRTEVAASAGSACHASGGKVSPVLVAMGVPPEFAGGTLRLSVGPGTTEDDVDRASAIIVREARRQLEGKGD